MQNDELAAFAVVAAALLHIVASQPLGLEVETKPKVSNGHEELDHGSSLMGQVKSEQPLTSGSMSLEGDIKPTHNTEANRQFVFSPVGMTIPTDGWYFG